MNRRLKPTLAFGMALVLISCSSLTEPTTPSQKDTRQAPSAGAPAELEPPDSGATLPPGFAERTVLEGLVHPTALAIARDGRVFVSEKSGRILLFDGLEDTTPQVVADLSSQVYDFYEMGMLDVALDPSFPEAPYLYVTYTHDAAIGGDAPEWQDLCPGGPGPDSPGCEISGRISRLEIAGDDVVGGEKVLIEDWCGQFESHSVGALAFGPDGALYASGGEGASPHFPDYGQLGDPQNVCRDPANEGGALRSQDLLSRGDPQGLSGAVIRVDASNGNGMSDNPLAGDGDPNTERIIAEGLRNPFRMAFDPISGELWIGDVGWANWDELNRLRVGGDVVNYGWPCFEGGSAVAGTELSYQSLLAELDPSATWNLDEAAATIGNGASSGPALVGGGQSLVLDGTGGAVADLDPPAVGDAFSFALWFVADTWDGNPQLIGGGKEWEVAFDDTVFFRLRIDGENHFASVPTAPELHAPHFLVATYSGSRQRVYLDGQVVADNVLTGSFNPNDDIQLGSRFRGTLDEAALFGRELPGSEINRLWESGSGERAVGGRQPRYAPLGLAMCEHLYADPAAVTPPHTGYEIGTEVAPGDGCPTGANALSGLAFSSDLNFPDPWNDGLFFSDFTRGCIWFLPRAADGTIAVDPVLFMRDAALPVDLVSTRVGTLAYVDFVGGTVREIYFE